MDEQKPREGDVEPRMWQASDDDLQETAIRDPSPSINDNLSRRREEFRRALTDRERTERWPCG
jgi:hypothetical protein